MERPKVDIDDIIRIGNHFMPPKAKMVRIYTAEEKECGLCGDIEVIYNQNGLKAVKEDLVWDGEKWIFNVEGPNGIAYDLNKYLEIK